MFKDNPSNTNPFIFSIDTLDIETFFVKEYSAHEKIGDLYTYFLTLYSLNHDIKSDLLINKRANLFIERGGQYIPVSGIVSEFTHSTKLDFYSVYKVTLVPTMWSLTLTKQSRIFQKKTDVDIIKEILDNSRVKDCYKIEVKGALTEREYVVQYDETDYNFICRLLARNGLWYIYNEDSPSNELSSGLKKEKLIITNKPECFIAVPLVSDILYKTSSELVQIIDKKMYENVYEFESHRKMIPQKVIVKTSNYRTPEVDITGIENVKNGDDGFIYRYGGSAKNIIEAQQEAVIEAKKNLSKQITYSGKSSGLGFRCGYRFNLKEHIRNVLNQQYVVNEIWHKGSVVTHDESILHSTYYNKFTAIDMKNSNHYTSDTEFTAPQMPDYISARVEGSGTDYATLDEYGRYKVRMSYDISSNENYGASKYIRMVQYYSGDSYGMHFPSHENAEIIISHINGNPDKPIGIRVVPDANTVSPVRSKNHIQSVIRTAGGNEIIMDDSDGKQKMCLNTPYDINWSAGHNETESVTSDRSVLVGGDEIRNVTADQALAIKANRTIEIGSNNKITVSGSEKVDITGSAAIKISGNSEENVSGDHSEKFSSTRKIEVSGDNSIKSGASHVVEVNGMETINVSGNVKIEAGSNTGVSAKATCVIMGTIVTFEGSSDLGVEAGAGSIVVNGEGVNIAAPLITITAGIIKSDAKGNNNITGMAVMLN
jgi:type VI secretion system secreted protein VgrG